MFRCFQGLSLSSLWFDLQRAMVHGLVEMKMCTIKNSIHFKIEYCVAHQKSAIRIRGTHFEVHFNQLKGCDHKGYLCYAYTRSV